MPWTTLCEVSELTEGEARPVEIDGYRLAVFLHEGRPFVLGDACPHAGASMSGGWIEAGCAVCPRHLWRFNLADGKLHGSGADGLDTYVTRIVEHQGRALLQADLRMP
ncbi:MAG TPA: Rieske 2Fe-2S domain-containing protein [Tepidisphaeraceae bacterium]|jgi:nitrite reductase (NADH) small subunit/3-phenylpropionate/trans-cinnamate dioxygenase ferredoxin subunit